MCCAQALGFLIILYVGLIIIGALSIPFYVVTRNSVPTFTALLEYLYTNTKTRVIGIIGLSCTIIGAIFFGFFDHNHVVKSDFMVILIAIFYVILVASLSIFDKIAVRLLMQNDNFTINECT